MRRWLTRPRSLFFFAEKEQIAGERRPIAASYAYRISMSDTVYSRESETVDWERANPQLI